MKLAESQIVTVIDYHLMVDNDLKLVIVEKSGRCEDCLLTPEEMDAVAHFMYKLAESGVINKGNWEKFEYIHKEIAIARSSDD